MVKQAFQTRGRLGPHTEWSQITQQLRAPCSSCFRGLLSKSLQNSNNSWLCILGCSRAGSIKGFYEKIFYRFFTWALLTALWELRGARSYSSLSGAALKPNLISLWGSYKAPPSDLRRNLAWGRTLLRKKIHAEQYAPFSVNAMH